MAICREDKAYFVIEEYGNDEEREALDILRGCVWDKRNSIISALLTNWSLDTANRLQADNKAAIQPWYMEDD